MSVTLSEQAALLLTPQLSKCAEEKIALSDAFKKLSDGEKISRLVGVMRKLEQKLKRVTRNRSLSRQPLVRQRTKSI